MANQEVTLTPEILVPRLGDYLVENQFITQEQLDLALQRQSEIQRMGKNAPLLGAILVDMGVIQRSEMDHAITAQVLQLRTALEEANKNLEMRVIERTWELEKAMQKLAELNQLKSNFVSNISHELLTPLTHIKGFLNVLESGSSGPVNKEQIEFLQTMQKASDKLEHLIQDLIAFSATEHGELHLNKQTIHVGDLCIAAVRRSQYKAEQKNIPINTDFQSGLPFIEGDQQKLLWVFIQLLDNAIKFTDIDGSITIKNRWNELENTISISVKDNGIGIPEERIQEIFEPFHQLDGSATRKAGGTGLGLALAQKIIEAHGAKLNIISAPDQGSEFIVTIHCMFDPSFQTSRFGETTESF